MGNPLAVKGLLVTSQQHVRVKNIRMSSDWLRIASLLSDISRSMACSAFIHDGHVLNWSYLELQLYRQIKKHVPLELKLQAMSYLINAPNT